MKKILFLLILLIFAVLSYSQDIYRTEQFKNIRTLWNALEDSLNFIHMDSLYTDFYDNLNTLYQEEYIDSIMGNMMLCLYDARIEYRIYGGIANAVRSAPDVSLIAVDSAVVLLENSMLRMPDREISDEEADTIKSRIELSVRVILCRQYAELRYANIQYENDPISEYMKHCRKVASAPKMQNEMSMTKFRNIDLYVDRLRIFILKLL